MSDDFRTRDDWEFDEECPECGESVYLSALVTEKDDNGPIKADMQCGEKYYAQNNASGIPTRGDERGCGHTWEWERKDD